MLGNISNLWGSIFDLLYKYFEKAKEKDSGLHIFVNGLLISRFRLLLGVLDVR